MRRFLTALVVALGLSPALAHAQPANVPWPNQCPSGTPSGALGCFPQAAAPLGTDLIFGWEVNQLPKTRAFQVQQLFNTNLPFASGLTAFVRIRMATSDFVAGSVGSFINEAMGATTGNTYGQFQVFTVGGLSPGNLILQPVAGDVCIHETTCAFNLHVNGTFGTSDTVNVILPAGSTDKAFFTSQTGPSSATVTYPGAIKANQIVGSFDAQLTGPGSPGTPNCPCWGLFVVNASTGPHYEGLEAVAISAGLVTTGAELGHSDHVAGGFGVATGFILNGRIYGGTSAATVGVAGGTPDMIGHEFGVAQNNPDTSKVPYRYAVNAINYGQHQAGTLDTAFAVEHGPPGAGLFQHVIALGLGNAIPATVINTTGDFLFSETAQTVGSIINLPNITATNYVLNTPNSLVTGSGNVLHAGYLRIGSTSAPANTAAGDLTVGRLSLGNGQTDDAIIHLRSTVSGASTAYGILVDPVISNTVFAIAIGMSIEPLYLGGGPIGTLIQLRLGLNGPLPVGTVTNQIALRILSNVVGATNNTGIQNNVPADTNNLGYDGTATGARNIMSSLSLGTRTAPGGTDGSLVAAGSVVSLPGIPASAGGDVALCYNTTTKNVSTGPCVP